MDIWIDGLDGLEMNRRRRSQLILSSDSMRHTQTSACSQVIELVVPGYGAYLEWTNWYVLLALIAITLVIRYDSQDPPGNGRTCSIIGVICQPTFLVTDTPPHREAEDLTEGRHP